MEKRNFHFGKDNFLPSGTGKNISLKNLLFIMKKW